MPNKPEHNEYLTQLQKTSRERNLIRYNASIENIEVLPKRKPRGTYKMRKKKKNISDEKILFEQKVDRIKRIARQFDMIAA